MSDRPRTVFVYPSGLAFIGVLVALALAAGYVELGAHAGGLALVAHVVVGVGIALTRQMDDN